MGTTAALDPDTPCTDLRARRHRRSFGIDGDLPFRTAESPAAPIALMWHSTIERAEVAAHVPALNAYLAERFPRAAFGPMAYGARY